MSSNISNFRVGNHSLANLFANNDLLYSPKFYEVVDILSQNPTEAPKYIKERKLCRNNFFPNNDFTSPFHENSYLNTLFDNGLTENDIARLKEIFNNDTTNEPENKNELPLFPYNDNEANLQLFPYNDNEANLQLFPYNDNEANLQLFPYNDNKANLQLFQHNNNEGINLNSSVYTEIKDNEEKLNYNELFIKYPPGIEIKNLHVSTEEGDEQSRVQNTPTRSDGRKQEYKFYHDQLISMARASNITVIQRTLKEINTYGIHLEYTTIYFMINGFISHNSISKSKRFVDIIITHFSLSK